MDRQELNLLSKTEIVITGLQLARADLGEIGRRCARALGVAEDEIMVTDVGTSHLTLDLLRRTIAPEQIAGKGNAILAELGAITGVTISAKTEIHSAGILGLIVLDDDTARQALAESARQAGEIRQRVARRARIYPTGFELQQGLIEDTNTPYLAQRLSEEGFQVNCGRPLSDDVHAIAADLREAIDSGYGLVVTTGGVGAEKKDQTVEALLKVDPGAATRYLVKFTQGTGRHHKDGVRIAVGRLGLSTLISLPGPNDEVRLALEALLPALRNGASPEELADRLAGALRGKFSEKMQRHHSES